MVNKKLFYILALLIFSSCSLPQYYNEFDDRFSNRNEFNFLTDSDKMIVLPDDYSFIVVSDIHIYGQDDADEFAKIKNYIDDAKFVVVTGDVTDDGTEEQIQRFINAASTFGVPVYPVVGNHDVYTDRASPWKKLIGSSMYRIDSESSSTSLFVLDNANGSFGYDQLKWFENEIKSSKKHCFVFAHENFFFEGSPPDFEHTIDINERALFMSLLKNHCDIMFMGHLHKRIVKEYSGVKYIMIENYGSSDGQRTICRVFVSNNEVAYVFESL
jgi:predicted phosphodiesterase